MVKTVSSVGTVTIAVNTACMNLKPAPICGSANRWWMPIGIENTRNSTKATRPHRVAVQAPADRAWHDRIEGDVGRHEPEVDDRVQRPREQHARQSGVDRVLEAERHRQDQDDDFRGRTDRRPGPQPRGGDRAEHCQRHGRSRMAPLPGAQVDHHQRDPDPRADHHEHDAEVVERAGDERRIEGVEHRRVARWPSAPKPSACPRRRGRSRPRPSARRSAAASARARRPHSRSPSRSTSGTRTPSPCRAR